LADEERADGLTEAAAALEYYLQGSGAERRISSSFLQNIIEVAMPEIHSEIGDLVTWYIQKNFSLLANCDFLYVGPDVYAKGYEADHVGNAFGKHPEQLQTAATFGAFRIDAELFGRLTKVRTPGLYNVDAQMIIHVVLLDVYDWNKSKWVMYPPYPLGNWIWDDWAANLEKHGSAKSYFHRGDYTYKIM
jgi:hypothetical protein